MNARFAFWGLFAGFLALPALVNGGPRESPRIESRGLERRIDRTIEERIADLPVSQAPLLAREPPSGKRESRHGGHHGGHHRHHGGRGGRGITIVINNITK